MTLETVLSGSAALEQANISTLELTRVYNWDELPEAMREFPCTIRYPVKGDTAVGASLGAIWWHQFNVEVHIMRGHLPLAMEVVVPFIEKFRDLYATNKTLGAVCLEVQLNEKPFYEVAELAYPRGSEEIHVGIVFHFVAKEQKVLAVAP